MRKHLSSSEKKFELKRIVRATAIVIAVAVAVALVLFFINLWENSQQGRIIVPSPSKTEDKITVDGVTYSKKKNIETLLLMGLDKYDGEQSAESYNNNLQSDFLMLFVFDHEKASYSALHINRDTMADIDVLGLADEKTGSVNGQIALAHTYGDGGSSSSRNVVKSVSRLLNNAEIEHYLSVTMDVVPYVNDMLGGVEVTVSDDFTGIDDNLIQGETVTLWGDSALNFVRSRQGMKDETNSTRMVRQRQYMESMFDKAGRILTKDETLAVQLTEGVWDNTVTDYDIVEMQDVIIHISDYEFDEFYVLDGNMVEGERYLEFYPTEDSVNDTIIKLFYKTVD